MFAVSLIICFDLGNVKNMTKNNSWNPLFFFTNCLKLFSLIPATYLLLLFISQVVLLFIIERNIPLVLCIPCVLFIVKIKYLENIRVDQLYHKKFEGKDIDPSISVEVNMVMMLVKHIFFNLSGHLIPINKQNSRKMFYISF